MARLALAAAILTATLLLLAWHRGWFSGEPTYRGRTATEWLDKLVLYEYRTEPGTSWIALRAPKAIAGDPAYQALLKIGSNGLPTFIQTLNQRAEWSPEVTTFKRWKMWVQWRWHQVRGAQLNRPAPIEWSEVQRARKTAAGFALIGLGTNAGGGFSKYMEVYASAPKRESVYGPGVAGTPVGISSSTVVRSVIYVIPERREEIVGEIMTALQNTNAWCRLVAQNAQVCSNENCCNPTKRRS